MGEDRDLIRLARMIKEHNIQSFHDLYIRYMPILQAFAFRYTYNSETAKDLVHDAFTWLWNHPEKIETHRNIVHLLHMMVRNNCLHYLRSLRIRDRHDEKLAEAILFSSDASSMEDLDDLQQHLVQKLHATLALLSPKSHEILLLHVVDGLKIKQIAEKFGIEESSVKTHIKRAMKLLRESLPAFFWFIF